MLIHDPIYGDHLINDPVLIELIHCPAFQRLRGVYQYGITAVLGIRPPATRYEHCVGTMLLLRRLGASLEEQIAGLLHDVSHTALSHVMDYAMSTTDESFHEKYKWEYVDTTEIPAILERHGFDYTHVLDEAHFSLLERDAPALCADRVDNALRDMMHNGVLPLGQLQDISKLFQAVSVEGTAHIVMRNHALVTVFSNAYRRLNKNVWANELDVGKYTLAGHAIKRALAVGHLDMSDVWLTDEIFWDKVCCSSDPHVCDFVNKLNDDKKVHITRIKNFSIDPHILQADGTVCKLSDYST
jgi:HD superfamily phosphohydrolase